MNDKPDLVVGNPCAGCSTLDCTSYGCQSQDVRSDEGLRPLDVKSSEHGIQTPIRSKDPVLQNLHRPSDEVGRKIGF